MDPMMFGPKPSSPPTPLTIHYYGDIVRALLLAAGAIVLVFSPSHPELMPLGTLPVVIVILLSVLLAGLTSPKQIGVMFANAAVSALGIVFFEYIAIVHYQNVHDISNIVFILQQLIAVIFFFALYYASKSIRGRVAP
ncbi:hypothetical protein A3D66_02670 [Candidatus Kaiserbacteria bacterium RIFCSPHIGHO2_02_FULL_50_9]|uniref:Uncharacterized protein n=1 Tax=Candidatus Kaiserbacteria bacterium RIFCSPLOWO2_01_FULL_51_21 TaxID=1798508 RepID=A0A1F6EDL7_9BACT|nr:MAG: hypothetical protein A2761_00530 [Candidatus Kaiserbacteria bacterium RIFCSPHIGHO2_01_FULL_51_33]OGG63558.1 MAG: hypothetical protein A3D66_02670 [Candidatus Kaiserbacteria bacterium RIFCSPHIGHO2_02_FULL_50_9]OGG71744.1 MAG: hypothetical protein A3A35_01955 [Candidatus Kaiserbacteria bacterium RIFCSPLOWO2_01_FULL_51_21]